jgi:hypothetical protein
VNLGEAEMEDVYGLHNVIDDIIKDKAGSNGPSTSKDG